MTIIVCSAAAAPAVLRERRPDHVVSLLAPGAEVAPPPVPADRWLHLEFHDIAAEAPGLTAPSPAHIARLLAFLRAGALEGELLIHCLAGVSRSPAAAYVAACLRGGAGREAEIAGRLRARAPTATPNPRVIALADQALGRRGAMVAAIAAIGRGVEWSGPPDAFEL
jgi:predicted protein tyrosine phosphatase